MSPDTSSREALPLVKKFLKDNPQGSTTSTGAKGSGQATVTEKFYTFWRAECPSVCSVNNPYRRVSPSYACRASMLPTSIALVVCMMLRRAPFAPRVWRSPASGTQQASRG